jgi:hypothetical protein
MMHFSLSLSFIERESEIQLPLLEYQVSEFSKAKINFRACSFVIFNRILSKKICIGNSIFKSFVKMYIKAGKQRYFVLKHYKHFMQT